MVTPWLSAPRHCAFAALAALYCLCATATAAPREEVVFSFAPPPFAPLGEVAQGADGTIYATTSAGGGPGYGTLFKVGADKIPQTLVEFTGTGGACKGAQPAGGLVFGADGRLYGTTARGGENDLGTIFSVTTDGTFITLREFDGANLSHGAAPYAGLLNADDGTLYGTTSRGGESDAGTLFQFDPASGGLSTIIEFTGVKGFAKGAAPFGPVTFGSDGKLYGTTSHGGAADHGTIFSYDLTTGTFKSLLEFSDNGTANKGTAPYGGLVRASNDRLYGTTARGGSGDQGTLFSVSNNGQLITHIQFTGNTGVNRGALPEATLVRGMSGTLYGTTYSGGKAGAGTVFEVTLNGKLTTRLDFTGAAGAAPGAKPQAGLILGNNGSFYGSTFAGGAGNAGTVFKMGPAGEFEKICELPGLSLATYSQPGVIPGPQQSFFGVTKLNGAPGKGTAFRISYTGEYTTLAEFTGTSGPTKGDAPSAAPLFFGGNFFGTTAKGGAADLGTIYKLQTDGTLTTVVEFTGPTGNAVGATPRAALISDGNGAFLGTTAEGGAANLGTIFKVTALGDFTPLVDFTGNGAANKGASPQSALIPGGDGKFYGVTIRGGASDLGTIYQLDLSGATPALQTLVEFDDAKVNGAFPAGPLAVGADGRLYGPTATGGATGNGTLFQASPSHPFISLLDFSDHRATNKGAFPRGPLALSSDGNFYGATGFGGTRALGTIFKFSPSAPATLTTLAEFAYGGTKKDAAYPETGFAEGTDGNLYATSSAGGEHGAGTVFRLRLRALPISLEAGLVQSDAVRLRARIQAGGLPAQVSFEYGDDAYGQITAAQSVGTGTTDSVLIALLTGLQPNTLYHYRVVITDSSGTVVGKDQTFTTEPLATQVIASGNLIASEPDSTTVKDFGTPAIADAGVIAVAANLNTAATGVVPVILVGNPPTVLLRKGDVAPLPGSPAFTSFGDPAIDSNLHVAFTAKAGLTTGLFTNTTGTLAAPAVVGGNVPDIASAHFTAISSFALSNSGALFYLATISGGGATAATNQGIWVNDGATDKLLLRRGDPIANSKIASITALSPVTGSTGQGRGYYDKMLVARVTLLNGAQALVRLTPTTAPDVTGPTPLSLSIHPPIIFVQKMGVPSVTAAGGLAFLGTLNSLGGPKPAIVTSNPTSLDDPNLRVLTRSGYEDTGLDGAAFSTFGDPVYNAQYVAAFSATISGFGVTAANNTGLWLADANGPQLIARRGDEPPGAPGALFDSFTSLALPDNAGPFFLAKIAPAKNTTLLSDVTPANNLGLWAVDSTGTLRLLVRTGDTLKIDGAAMTVSLLTLLNAVPGSPGQARSYNSTHDLTFRSTFTDHTQAILRLHVP